MFLFIINTIAALWLSAGLVAFYVAYIKNPEIKWEINNIRQEDGDLVAYTIMLITYVIGLCICLVAGCCGLYGIHKKREKVDYD